VINAPTHMLGDATVSRAAAMSTATLHEAGGRRGALPSSIKPFAPDARLCGRAFPVKSPSGDNLWLHHAIYAASAGDVLVVDVGSAPEFGYWGEVMGLAAQTRRIAGLVINGGVRDAQRMAAMGFAFFSTTPCIRGTAKNPTGRGELGKPIVIGDVTIVKGDLVVGDSDGVVALPAARAAEIIEAGERRDAEEERILRRLRAGETTIDIYELPLLTGLQDLT
jgi:4-hydroxy-4-methyl-2-oxoglutarate aldolase